MGAIDYLRNHGFDAKVKGNRLVVSPASKLTAGIRQYIKLHRLELLVEVAANDPPPPPAQPAASAMASSKSAQPDEPQHLVLSAATAAPEWIAARDPYVNHLMSCQACFAPKSRYCVTGAELRQRYDQTPMEPTL